MVALSAVCQDSRMMALYSNGFTPEDSLPFPYLNAWLHLIPLERDALGVTPFPSGVVHVAGSCGALGRSCLHPS